MEAKIHNINPQFNHASRKKNAPIIIVLTLQVNQRIHEKSGYTIMNPALATKVKHCKLLCFNSFLLALNQGMVMVATHLS